SSDTLLYVGKSVKLRDRVRSHFSGDHSSDRELEMCSQIARIEHLVTGGDLGARLLEAKLIKERSPVYNRQLRKTKTLWYMELQPDAEGYLRVAIKSGRELPADLSRIVGLFRSRRMAEEKLRVACDEARLCQRLTGLDNSRKGACFGHQLQRCAGGCVGKDSSEDYNRRREAALDAWRFRAWPFAGPVALAEGGEYHLLDQWCHLGSAPSLDALPQLKGTAKLEYDIYKILLTFLSRKEARSCEVIPLPDRCCLPA